MKQMTPKTTPDHETTVCVAFGGLLKTKRTYTGNETKSKNHGRRNAFVRRRIRPNIDFQQDRAKVSRNVDAKQVKFTSQIEGRFWCLLPKVAAEICVFLERGCGEQKCRPCHHFGTGGVKQVKIRFASACSGRGRRKVSRPEPGLCVWLEESGQVHPSPGGNVSFPS